MLRAVWRLPNAPNVTRSFSWTLLSSLDVVFWIGCNLCSQKESHQENFSYVVSPRYAFCLGVPQANSSLPPSRLWEEYAHGVCGYKKCSGGLPHVVHFVQPKTEQLI